MGVFQKIDRPLPWLSFALLMVAGVPYFGSVLTLVGAIAAMVALQMIWQDPRRFPLLPAAKPLLFGFLVVTATLSLSGLINGEPIRFLVAFPLFSQFLYFIPLLFVLPVFLTDLKVLTISRAAMVGVSGAFILGVSRFLLFPSGCMALTPGQPLCLELSAGNPLVLAGALFVMTLLIPLGFVQKSLAERALSLAVMGCGIFTFAYLADGRGAALSFLLISPIVFLFLCRSVGWRLQRVVWAAGLALAVLLVLGWANLGLVQNSSFVARMEKIPQSFSLVMAGDRTLTSTTKRIAMYAAGYQAAKQAPILGHGPQNRFSAAKPFLSDNMTQDFTHLHNMMLTQWVAAGILGVLALLATLLAPMWISARHLSGAQFRDLRYMAAIVSFGPLLLGLSETIFFHDLNSTFHLFNIVLFTALATSRLRENEKP